MINPINPVDKSQRVRFERDVHQAEKLVEVDEELVKKIHEALVNRQHSLHEQLMEVLSQQAPVFHSSIQSFHNDKGSMSVDQIERNLRRFFKVRQALIKALKEVLES